MSKHEINPVVNMNGTSEADLMEAFLNARESLLEAFDQVRATAPNGRDYQAGGDLNADVAEYQRRARQVEELAELFYHDAIRLQDRGTQ